MRYFTRLCFLFAFLAVLLPQKLSAQYKVSGSEDPDRNGMYVLSGSYNSKPVYSNGNYSLYYKDCTTKWAIGTATGNCPYFSTYSDGDVPDNMGWHRGGKYSGNITGSVMVAKMNSLAYNRNWLIESAADDGTFNDSLQILLNSVENPFTGNNGEDFMATGKIVVSGVPEGLTLKVLRTDDYTLTLKISGTAANHAAAQNTNLTIAFQNSAFTDADASEIAYATYSGVKILFMTSYLITGANETPQVNDTFKLAGIFNGKPTYSNGEYAFIYKGCQWGAKWALTYADGGGCPAYSTSVDGDDLPSAGWYDDGQGAGNSDTLFVTTFNSIQFGATTFMESALNDGSIENPLVIKLFARSTGNAFTGDNGDDFIADGKATVAQVPEGLVPHIVRVNDTTLVFGFEGNATNHTYVRAVKNITVSLLNTAFTSGNAGAVNNAVTSGLGIDFNQEILVVGAHYNPEVNGVYLKSDTHNGAPVFSKGSFSIVYRDCGASWVIIDGVDMGNCAIYSTSVEDEKMPPYEGWSDGGSGGNGNDSIWVIAGNALIYSRNVLRESGADDGSVADSIVITRTYNPGMNNFSGNDGDDFVAGNKVTVTNVPEGLSAAITRRNDSTVVLKLTGKAVHHSFAGKLINLEIEFTDAAFTDGNAIEFNNYQRTDIHILNLIRYEVFGSQANPDLNGTYVAEGFYNDRIYLSKDEYRMGYRGCNTKWVIIDGNDSSRIQRGNCPQARNHNNSEMPPRTGWDIFDMQVYPHNSLYYSKTALKESTLKEGSIDNSDTLVITYFFPPEGAAFSGENGDDFVTGGKVTISNLPDGLAASIIRSSDTTLQVVFNGNTRSGNVYNLSFAFTDGAFTGAAASDVLFSTRTDLVVNFHNEFWVASTGGDFATITEAVNSWRVNDGDILNLAAETFTDYSIIVSKALTFRGEGAGKTIIQAAPAPGATNNQIFTLLFNESTRKSVVFENLTLRNGRSGNYGGAIYSQYAELFISNCELVDNLASNNGGAVYVIYGNLICKNTTFTGNKLDYSTTNTNYGGAAISYTNNNDFSKALIENCTFSGNSCASYGGALFTYGNTLVVNSTFSNNSAYRGGAMYRFGFDLNLLNTLVANNTATNAGPDLYGTLNADYSLIENISGVTISGSNNITSTDPALGTLADNGGATKTCAIGSMSAAADKGTNIATPQKDQRGIQIANGIRDIGAFEYNDKPVILLCDTLMNTLVIAKDSVELKYTVSAVNLTSLLTITTPVGVELSLTSGASFTPEAEILLDHDVNGLVPETDIFVKIKAESVGPFSVKIAHSATDAPGRDLVLNITGVSKPEGANDTLIVATNLTASFTRENFTCSDADGDVLAGILVVSKETTGDLEFDEVNVTGGTVCLNPSLITFKPFDNESGRPYASFEFRLIDARGLMSDSTYTMTIFVNNTPQVMNSIPDGNANVGTAYSYVVPENTFGDADDEDELTYAALLSDGSALPAWLTFVPATRTFSGTPAAIGTLTIRVIASDDLEANVYDEYVLTISPASAIDDPLAESISVFPNPTSGKVYITLAAGNGDVRMTLMGINGRVLVNKTLTEAKNEVDLTGYARGVYLMKLSDSQHNTVRRIVVQ